MLDRGTPCDPRNYHKLINALPYGVLRYDDQGLIREANNAASRILGVAIEELYDRSLSESNWRLVDANERRIELDEYPLARSIKTGKPVRDYLVGAMNPLSGRFVWLRGDIVPQTMIESGQTEYWVIFHDVTEQHEAEENLRESRSNLDLAQRVASVGSAVYNFRTRLWSWSAEMARLYALPAGSSTGSVGPDQYASLISEDDRPAYLAGIRDGLNGLAPAPLEFCMMGPDGARHIIQREAELISGAGRVSGVIFTHKDVTEAREAERQKDIYRQRLYHAQRLEALGTLASGIAHDLNNTLVPIIGLTQSLLATDDTDPNTKPLLELIQKGGLRARDLVRRVLDFSRKEIAEKAVFDLASVVQETLTFARASVPPSIEIRTHVSPVGLLNGDATQIHQLLLNLVANASQAIESAEGTMTVSLRDSPRDRKLAELEVSDNGIGMDSDTRKRIFEPFFTTKSVGAGTGLGLSVVHSIVQSHRGEIDVFSKPGQGSTFIISLPKHQVIDGNEESTCH